MIEYQLIKSKRKTLAIYVKSDGQVQVRAPFRMSQVQIDAFVDAKMDWIKKARTRFATKGENRKVVNLSPKEVMLAKEKAGAYLKSRCPYFAEKMGVRYSKITVNKAKTRWGSCSAKGNINFTYRLLFAPEEVIDYVIVHELAHLKEMNHSQRFWDIVKDTMPDYKDRRGWLREFQMNLEIVESEV